ncbi:MAG: sulfurtransferase [Gammaproteobacteria bacterium]|nr:MAG: sulfurtransferase [Gammaproteobacteria bacterium]
MFTTLVDTDTLARHLADPRWVVVDCRFTLTDTGAGRRAWTAGHIPGARYAHLDEDLSSPITPRTGRHPLPDPNALARKLGAWGIDESKQVVVYDDTFGAMASRLWWLLRWLGHESVALLDGSYPKWVREKKPVTPEAPVVHQTTFYPRVNNTFWVNADFVERVRQDEAFVVFDARAEERFRGEVEPLDKVAGHVPGAVNAMYEDNLDVSGEFLSAEELRERYLDLLGGVVPDQAIHMCGSGVTACHNVLAMEHAGLPGARLYAGSWSEWITDPNRPVATGE